MAGNGEEFCFWPFELFHSFNLSREFKVFWMVRPAKFKSCVFIASNVFIAFWLVHLEGRRYYRSHLENANLMILVNLATYSHLCTAFEAFGLQSQLCGQVLVCLDESMCHSVHPTQMASAVH